VKADVDANDPKALRAEITRLKAELAKQLASAPGADAAAIAAAEQRGYLRVFEEAKKQGTVAFEGLKEVRSTMQSFAVSFDGNVKGETIEFEIAPQQSGSPASIQAPAPTRRPVVPAAARPPSPAVGGDGNLSSPQQRILNSLATWAQMGEQQPNNAQVAWLAGYSPSSTSYTNPRSALKTAGLIDYPAKDQLAITADGTAAAKPFTLNGSLLEFVLSLLPGPEGRILRSVADHYPNPISNDEAATGANYSASSSSYTNPRSALRTKDLITYPVKDQVRAADWLFAR
jgi:hypothetical protein